MTFTPDLSLPPTSPGPAATPPGPSPSHPMGPPGVPSPAAISALRDRWMEAVQTLSSSPGADPRNLWQRLRDAQAEARGLPRRGTAPSNIGGYSYVLDADVQDSARELLTKHGLALVPVELTTTRQEAGSASSGRAVRNTHAVLRLELVNVDNPMQRQPITWAGEADDTGDRGAGKAATSAHKQALLKLLLLAGSPGTDPDADSPGDGTSRGRASAPRTSTRTPEPVPPGAVPTSDTDPRAECIRLFSEVQLMGERGSDAWHLLARYGWRRATEAGERSVPAHLFIPTLDLPQLQGLRDGLQALLRGKPLPPRVEATT